MRTLLGMLHDCFWSLVFIAAFAVMVLASYGYLNGGVR